MLPLRLLLIEDSEDHALLLERELRRGGFDLEVERVDTPEELKSALSRDGWNAVISDYSLPTFTGLDALRIVRESRKDIPFILISGVVGEERAVEAMKAGAHDFILKANLARIAPALERELGDAAVRRDRRRAEEALRQAHAELEQRVAERTAQLRAANTSLEEAIADLRREANERKQAEEALRETEKQNKFLADILEASSQPFAVGYADGRLELVNPAFERLTGYSGNELKALSWATTLTPPEWHEMEQKRLEELRSTGQPVRFEKEFLRKDGGRVPIEILVHFVPASAEKPEYYYAFATDITGRKQAEEYLQASLREKETLLKEIHHRVKNNLQVISSLVSLQAEGSKDEMLGAVLKDVTYRVRSMALVHEKLYHSQNLSSIDFAEYAKSLLRSLWRSHGVGAEAVRLTFDLEPVSLPVDTAVPCGLLLNELVTNALKHAFRGRNGGEVIMSLRRVEDGRLSLGVRDNGIGLPKGMDWRNARSLGLRLVQMLAGQLQATVEVDGSNGTHFMIAFDYPGRQSSSIAA